MKTNAQHCAFRLEKELVDRLKEEAKGQRRTMTNLLECILDEYFKKIDAEKQK